MPRDTPEKTGKQGCSDQEPENQDDDPEYDGLFGARRRIRCPVDQCLSGLEFVCTQKMAAMPKKKGTEVEAYQPVSVPSVQ